MAPYKESEAMKEVSKIWGKELWIVNNRSYCGKKLFLMKGGFSSLHCHHVKVETFYIESGKVMMEYDGKTFDMLPGDNLTILPGMYHRFGGYEDSIITEFSTFHSDNDVDRKEKSYLTPPLYGVDVDGTLEASGGMIKKEHLAGRDFVIVSSRSRNRSLEICREIGIEPLAVICCRVVSRAEELRQVDKMFPLRRTIYIGDMESDKAEALRAGWQYMSPKEFIMSCRTHEG